MPVSHLPEESIVKKKGLQVIKLSLFEAPDSLKKRRRNAENENQTRRC